MEETACLAFVLSHCYKTETRFQTSKTER